MPKLAIRFAESALTDLESMRTWYAEQGVPDVGERLLGEIVAAIEVLANHPDMGRIVPEFGQPLLRELIRPPFRSVYRRDPKRVRIVRAWRSERLLVVPGVVRISCAVQLACEVAQSIASSRRSSPQKISVPHTNVRAPKTPSALALSVSASYSA